MTQVKLARVLDQPIEPAELLAQVSRPEAGAVSLFVGVVRNHDQAAGGEVVRLGYSAHPSAPERMAQIVQATLATADPEQESLVAAVHRVGDLEVGEVAFAVAVSAGHRKLAFAVCEQVVEAVKAGLPVWKQQFEADGSYRWSGL